MFAVHAPRDPCCCPGVPSGRREEPMPLSGPGSCPAQSSPPACAFLGCPGAAGPGLRSKRRPRAMGDSVFDRDGRGRSGYGASTSVSEQENALGGSPRSQMMGGSGGWLESALGYYDILGGRPRFGAASPQRPPPQEYQDEYQQARGVPGGGGRLRGHWRQLRQRPTQRTPHARSCCRRAACAPRRLRCLRSLTRGLVAATVSAGAWEQRRVHALYRARCRRDAAVTLAE